MNVKVQEIMGKLDEFAERISILPKMLDKGMVFLKKPEVACIPTVISKIASKFSGLASALFSALFTLYCLKNFVISMFSKWAPTGIIFGFVITGLIALFINYYILYKTDGIFNKIITTSHCRISSVNIFTIFSFLFLFLAAVSLIGGLYAGIEFKSFQMIIMAIVGTLLCLVMSIFNANPEEFAIVEDSEASAGEDFVTIATFSIKIVLKLIPLVVFILPLIGFFRSIPEVFTTYIQEGEVDANTMMTKTFELAGFLMVGIIPLLAYFYYLFSYVFLDIIRAVLSLPHKLDELKK